MDDNYQRLIDALKACKHVLITTHVRPDGDALGSCAALVLGLKRAGIESQVLLLSPISPRYSFLFNDYAIPYQAAESDQPPALDLGRYDALLVADTGTWSQLPGLRERIEKWDRPKLVLDHHLTQEDWADVKLVDMQAAAAGEIVGELLDRWKIALDTAIATALYVAIASDTGWFQFSNTRPQTHRLAARLIEAGVDTDRLYQLLTQSERPQRLALQARLLTSLQFAADGKVAVVSLTKSDFDQTGAAMTDTENLINVPMQVGTVQVVAMIVERPGETRISLRSKGQVDVSQVAAAQGGGGHARAAAFSSKMQIDQARQWCLSQLATELAAS